MINNQHTKFKREDTLAIKTTETLKLLNLWHKFDTFLNVTKI